MDWPRSECDLFAISQRVGPLARSASLTIDSHLLSRSDFVEAMRHLSALQEISVQVVGVISLQEFQYAASRIKQLSCVDISIPLHQAYYGFGANSWAHVASTLLNNNAQSLVELTLPSGPLLQRNVDLRLVAALSECRQLESVHFRPGRGGHFGSTYVDQFKCRPGLVSLHYRGNQSAWGSLSGVLATCNRIASVAVKGKNDDAEYCKFWKAVRERPSIRSIVCHPPIRSERSLAAHDDFIRTLREHTGIEELSLQLAEIFGSAAFWQALCDSILGNPCGRIKKLRLNDLTLTAAGADQLVRLLGGGDSAGDRRPCTKLLELRINDFSQFVGTDAMQCLLGGLALPNCSLTAFVLECVVLSPALMAALALALHQENRLNHLELWRCRFDSESTRLLGEGLSGNTTVESLLLEGTFVGSPSYLIAGLQQNASIREVYVAGIDANQRLLCDMLEQNRSLEVIGGSRVKLDADSVLPPDPQQGQGAMFPYSSRQAVRALTNRPSLRHIEVEVAEPSSDWVQLRDIVVGCAGLQSIVCQPSVRFQLDGLDLAAALQPYVPMLRDAVRSHAPGLVHVLVATPNQRAHDDALPELFQVCDDDRTDIVRQWLKQDPRPDRATCALRMLAGPFSKQLDARQVCQYAARALRQSIGCPGDAFAIAGAVLDGMREPERGPDGKLREVKVGGQPVLYRTRGYLLPAAWSGTGLVEAMDAVARVRVNAQAEGPESEWAGPARLCERALRIDSKRRGGALLMWRRAVGVKRDSELIFRSARDGRPLELGKRLRLGRLGGGLWKKGLVEAGGVTKEVSAMEAACMGGHLECVRVLDEAIREQIGVNG